MRVSLTNAIMAGARSPDTYVKIASTRNAMNSGRSLMKVFAELLPTPITVSTDWMPTSCSAMYGISARMPVNAAASASPREPYLPRMKSAGVMYPCTRHTDQSLGRKMSTIGNTRIV
jgi:hypothetical protein